MFEQDYIMRLIHEVVRAILSCIFRIKEDAEERQILTETELEDYNELIRLADAGRINEAENLLYEKLDDMDYGMESLQEQKEPEEPCSSIENMKTALLFYEHINDYTDDFLEESRFSREEIKDGIAQILKRYGYDGMINLLQE